MMKWKLWELEGTTAVQMFETHFCRKRSAFYDWKKKHYKIDDTRSAAISAGIRRKQAPKSENQTSDTGQSPFEGLEEHPIQHVVDEDAYRRNFSPRKLAEQCRALREQLATASDLMQEFEGKPAFPDDEFSELGGELAGLINTATQLGECLSHTIPAEVA